VTTQLETRRIIRAIYTLGFIFAVHSALPTYINSEFLARFAGDKTVGLIYVLSSVATLLAFTVIGKTLRRYGDYNIIVVMTLVALFSVSGLLSFKDPIILTALFTIFSVAGSIIAFNIDVFLENFSKNSSTGSIRGNFLSLTNAAWIFTPLITGFILTDGDYWKIYLMAAILLIPMLMILVSNFQNFTDVKYHNLSVKKVITELPEHHSTYKILMSNFLLQFFFAWMVIYTPIYLHSYIGFGWDKIGIIFTIMLFPFALLEAPLGRLADKRYGEKEILSIGFVIIAVSTAALTLISGQNFYLWAIGLLLTRVGASMVQVMNETYFFKKNSSQDPDILSVFRMTGPFAFVIASLFGTILFMFTDYRQSFLILGVIMLLGLKYSLTIKDTL
jgi:MFS family permease